MCVNATKTAGALLAGIKPTIVAILAATGLTNTAGGLALIAAFTAAQTALQNWVSGTAAQDVIEALTAIQTVFSALPLPATVLLFSKIILGGIIAVIGIVTANSPAPAPPVGFDAHEDTQVMHQAEVAASTAAQVEALVPGFKRSIFHSPESQYKKAWNDAVAANPDAGIAAI
jgi:hypothetical protein